MSYIIEHSVLSLAVRFIRPEPFVVLSDSDLTGIHSGIYLIEFCAVYVETLDYLIVHCSPSPSFLFRRAFFLRRRRLPSCFLSLPAMIRHRNLSRLVLCIGSG
jgi:hypothetical protein